MHDALVKATRFWLSTSVLALAALAVDPVSWAQIPTTDVAVPAEPPKIATFDGSLNFLGPHPELYVGQDLFVPCLAEELRHFGYRDFYRSIPDHPGDHIYSPSGEGFSSTYGSLAGRTFTVQRVVPHPRASESLYATKSYLVLIAKDNGEGIYYEYDSKHKFLFPFIAMKYFYLQKADLIGAEFVTRGRKWVSEKEPMLDITTGKPVEFAVGQRWRVVDVSIEGRYCQLSAILQNTKAEKLALAIDNMADWHWAIPASVSDVYSKQLGAEAWQKVVGGLVALGMDAEIAKIAWGEPERKNLTMVEGRSSEQWVYKNERFLYVTNGKVTGLQGSTSNE